MRILICDDEEKYLSDLQKHVECYMTEHFIKCNIYSTTNPEEIINSNLTFDLAFLDVQMPEIDGIKLGKELKLRNSKIVLFFITAFEEYQDEAMDLHIFRFFKKPFDSSRLYSSLDKAMDYINESYIDIFLYNKGEHKKILVNDIICVKRENRKITLVTQNEEFVTRRSLSEWCDELPNTYFYLVHNSFLVNLHYVTQYNYNELYLNNIRIPIASRKQADFHKYWFAYLRRR